MRRAAFLVGLAACVAGGAAQGAILEEFSAEDWSGFALADDQTGRLASCAIYSSYQNGATLFFVKHVDGGWVLSLSHPSWALARDASYPVQYRIDREPYVEDMGMALDVDQIGLALRDDDPLLAQVRRGSLLNILFQSREFGFDLKNSGKALKAAADCTERNRDRSAPRVAGQESFAAPEQPPPAAADLPGGPTDASPLPDRQVFGPWVVTATRDGSGNFLNCTAFGVQGADQLILSYHADEAWDFSLYRGAWALNPDQSYLLSYNVDAPLDAAGTANRPVEAVDMTRILLELEREDDLISRIERGRELVVRIGGAAETAEVFRYRLEHAAEALAATRECTRRNAHGA